MGPVGDALLPSLLSSWLAGWDGLPLLQIMLQAMLMPPLIQLDALGILGALALVRRLSDSRGDHIIHCKAHNPQDQPKSWPVGRAYDRLLILPLIPLPVAYPPPDPYALSVVWSISVDGLGRGCR